MLRCMYREACGDSLFLFKAWLIKQRGNQPFASEREGEKKGLIWLGSRALFSCPFNSPAHPAAFSSFHFFHPTISADGTDATFIPLLCYCCIRLGHTAQSAAAKCVSLKRRQQSKWEAALKDRTICFLIGVGDGCHKSSRSCLCLFVNLWLWLCFGCAHLPKPQKVEVRVDESACRARRSQYLFFHFLLTANNRTGKKKPTGLCINTSKTQGMIITSINLATRHC